MASRQLELPFEPPKRLNLQSSKILARLKQGPATNVELSAIAMRYSARIYDLRKAGHVIDIIDRDHETGIYVYELK